jgi:hypothetical protein
MFTILVDERICMFERVAPAHGGSTWIEASDVGVRV